jgi:Na+/melibiose symporter-like transporter
LSSLSGLLCYGLFGLPLAMVALPIYVFVPQFYAQNKGLSLAEIGAALLAARVLAAFIDPALGWHMARRGGAYARTIVLSLPLLLLGFGALFHPPALAGAGALGWFLASLMLVYFGFGLATIAHQSWGAALTQAPSARARVTAVREGCGLIGVIAAAGLTALLGYDGLTLLFALCLLLGAALLLRWAPRPAQTPPGAVGEVAAGMHTALLAPLRGQRFRALFAVLIVNGVAAAIPATLFLFFVDDKLQLGTYGGLFLMLYFGAAAASMPLWVSLARRYGEARAWGAGMLLAALVFVWAYWLGAGALLSFGAICLLSGLALGADLALPPALLAGVIARAGHSGQREAAYFGLWNWGVQLNLALAAGIALPLLGWLGYVPGSGSDTQALSVAYALLPCALKLIAALMLWRAPLRDC